MNKWQTKKQRGSIEIVVLILVLAAAIGVVAWRIADTYNSQSDAESSASMANNAPDVATKYVEVSELNFSFSNPQSAGDISYTVRADKNIVLTSNKLQQEANTCEGEPSSEFGTIVVAHNNDPKTAPMPSYAKTIGDKEYRFSSTLEQSCYSESVVQQFTETIPSVVVHSIKES